MLLHQHEIVGLVNSARNRDRPLLLEFLFGPPICWTQPTTTTTKTTTTTITITKAAVAAVAAATATAAAAAAAAAVSTVFLIFRAPKSFSAYMQISKS